MKLEVGRVERVWELAGEPSKNTSSLFLGEGLPVVVVVGVT